MGTEHRVCLGPSKCGCHDNEFCLFEHGHSSGTCHKCAHYSDASYCYSDNSLTKRGRVDCLSCCHFNTHSPSREPTPEPTVSPTPEPTKSPTPEPTPAPTKKPTVSPTDEPTPMPTKRPTHKPTDEPTRKGKRGSDGWSKPSR